jgi:hypothetical protein
MGEKTKATDQKMKLEEAKMRKATIESMEKRIKELKKAIAESKTTLARNLLGQELKLVERRLAQFIENPSGKPFDEFAPLTDYSK